MRTTLAFLLLPALASLADRADDLTAAQAIRDYNFLLVGQQHTTIENIRDRLAPVMGKLSPRYAKSIRFQLDRGFKRKYGRSPEFLAVVSEILAKGGKAGIATLYKRYKAEAKRDDVRLGIARALGGCGDSRALPILLKLIHDKTPQVAAAAVEGCGRYATVKEKARKDACKQLVRRYLKATNEAAGKAPDTPQAKMFLTLRPAMNAALKSLSGGESLDSAEAWDAWLRENITRSWTE